VSHRRGRRCRCLRVCSSRQQDLFRSRAGRSWGSGCVGCGRWNVKPPARLVAGMGWDGMGWDGMGWGVRHACAIALWPASIWHGASLVRDADASTCAAARCLPRLACARKQHILCTQGTSVVRCRTGPAWLLLQLWPEQSLGCKLMCISCQGHDALCSCMIQQARLQARPVSLLAGRLLLHTDLGRVLPFQC
jgi:hypothetical protein